MAKGLLNNDANFGSNHHQFVRRRSGKRYSSECQYPSVKHSLDSFTVWVVSASSVGDLDKMNVIMDADKLVVGRTRVTFKLVIVVFAFYTVIHTCLLMFQ